MQIPFVDSKAQCSPSSLVGQERLIDLEKVEEITTAKQLSNNKTQYVLNISIPLNRNAEWLEKQVKRIVKERRKQLGVVGKGVSVGTAKYAIHGKAEAKALQKALRVWESIQSDLTFGSC